MADLTAPSDLVAFGRGLLLGVSAALALFGWWLVAAVPYPIIWGPIAKFQFLLGGAAMVLGSFLLSWLAATIALTRPGPLPRTVDRR